MTRPIETVEVDQRGEAVARTDYCFPRLCFSKNPHPACGTPPPFQETADLGPACWFLVSRRALLAPVAACGEATKPALAPNGSLNQQSLQK